MDYTKSSSLERRNFPTEVLVGVAPVEFRLIIRSEILDSSEDDWCCTLSDRLRSIFWEAGVRAKLAVDTESRSLSSLGKILFFRESSCLVRTSICCSTVHIMGEYQLAKDDHLSLFKSSTSSQQDSSD